MTAAFHTYAMCAGPVFGLSSALMIHQSVRHVVKLDPSMSVKDQVRVTFPTQTSYVIQLLTYSTVHTHSTNSAHSSTTPQLLPPDKRSKHSALPKGALKGHTSRSGSSASSTTFGSTTLRLEGKHADGRPLHLIGHSCLKDNQGHRMFLRCEDSSLDSRARAPSTRGCAETGPSPLTNPLLWAHSLKQVYNFHLPIV